MRICILRALREPSPSARLALLLWELNIFRLKTLFTPRTEKKEIIVALFNNPDGEYL